MRFMVLQVKRGVIETAFSHKKLIESHPQMKLKYICGCKSKILVMSQKALEHSTYESTTAKALKGSCMWLSIRGRY